MPSNLVPQSFYQNQKGNKNSSNNYNYEINLNAVNKSMNNNAVQANSKNDAATSQGSQGGHPRSTSHDYDNNPKSIYMSNKSNHSQTRTAGGEHATKGISSGGNNIIMEMEAE